VRLGSEQHVAHTSADEAGIEARVAEPPHDLFGLVT
jgi:hypothetical protein